MADQAREAFYADFAHYYNEHAELIGHYLPDVRAWLAAHPNYRGAIWLNWGDGSDDHECTDMFFGDLDDMAAAVAAKGADADAAIARHERSAEPRSIQMETV